MLFREALMLLCQLDQRPAKLLKDQKNVKKRSLCLAWAEPVGREPAVGSGCGRESWGTELEGASGAPWI